MISGLAVERAYSYFGTSKICHLLTYLDTYPLTARNPHGQIHYMIRVNSHNGYGRDDSTINIIVALLLFIIMNCLLCFNS